MSDSSRYYYLWRLDPASDRVGYQRWLVPLAQEFVREQGSIAEADTRSTDIQAVLLTRFQTPKVDVIERSRAGLCLRCYVSEPILNACRKIDRLFGNDRSFNYRDLLPFVLNDDGKSEIVLDRDGKTQLTVDRSGTPQPTAYKCFSIQILQTYKSDRASMSLDNWAYLQTKQHPELKNFLSEFGFKQLSDWALLNRVRPKQLAQLPARDRHFIEVFHAVYRRDRLHQNRGTTRCLDPTTAQLQEMHSQLPARRIETDSPQATLHERVMAELRRIAQELRQYDIWSYREPLEFADPDTGNRQTRSDLPQYQSSEIDIEQQELVDFCHQQLQSALVTAIDRTISDRLKTLEQSKGYAAFAHLFLPGLQLYYTQGLSLREIADLLGMSNWAQARRILNPGESIATVRTLTIRQLLERMLQIAQAKGLTQIPPAPDYLECLSVQIEAFADAEVFQPAFEEIQAGKNRQMLSGYARQLRSYLNEKTS